MAGFVFFILSFASINIIIRLSVCAQSQTFTTQKLCISNTDYNGTVLANLVDVASVSMCAFQCNFVVRCESFLFDIREHSCTVHQVHVTKTWCMAYCIFVSIPVTSFSSLCLNSVYIAIPPTSKKTVICFRSFISPYNCSYMCWYCSRIFRFVLYVLLNSL